MPENARRATWNEFRIPTGTYEGHVDDEAQFVRVNFHVVRGGRLADACVLKIHTEGRWRAFATMYVREETGRPFMSQWPSWGPSLQSERNAAITLFQYACWRFEPTMFDDVRDQDYTVVVEAWPGVDSPREQLAYGPRYDRDDYGLVNLHPTTSDPVIARPRRRVSAIDTTTEDDVAGTPRAFEGITRAANDLQEGIEGLGRILSSVDGATTAEATQRTAAINAIRGRWHPGQRHLTPSETQIRREITRQTRAQALLETERSQRQAREQRLNVTTRTRRPRAVRVVTAHSFFNNEEVR